MTDALLTILIFATAVLYSSVGQAGASGYLGVMAVCGVPASEMRPAALVLNLLVATITTVRFARAGCVPWKLLWPLVAASAPFAFLGAIVPPGRWFQPLVGVVLLTAAFFLFRDARKPSSAKGRGRSRPPGVALAFGAGIGLVSGLTGMGGGVLLSPILLFLGWNESRRTAGVTAAFILVNSAAGLAGQLVHARSIPGVVYWWVPAALIGGWIGSGYGSRRLGGEAMRRILAVVLLIAGLKLIVWG